MLKVTVESMDKKKHNEVIETESYEFEALAKKAKKTFIKKYNLIKHAGHVVNYSKRLELYTNF